MKVDSLEGVMRVLDDMPRLLLLATTTPGHTDLFGVNLRVREARAYLATLAEQAKPVADPQLLAFYQVSTVAELLAAQEAHILQLQDAARRNVKPWEDTFPPTLLPKYMRDSGLAPPSALVEALRGLERTKYFGFDWVSADELDAILAAQEGEK